MVEKKELIKVVNDIKDTDNVGMDSFILCGSDDYCDACVGICMPQYH